MQVNTPASTTTPTVCVKFSNDSVGYIGGLNGSLEKTVNGGISWATQHTGATAAIKRIYTFGDSVYFLTSTNQLFKNKPESQEQAIQHVHKDSSNNNTLLVYPNPSNNIIYVEFLKENVGNLTITITNSLGKELYRQDDASKDLTYKSMLNIQSYSEVFIF